MVPKKIIVLFKTHLDIGFTDLSAKVTEKYMKEFIPNAIRVGEELAQQCPPVDFCWTTGSWLVYEYLQRAGGPEAKRLEEAIQKGYIAWHGLPFTMHSEYMTKELFAHGLALSKQLDCRFEKQTIAAKLTDVPGHTKAIVPLLAGAGLEFLHIGVNGASPNPVTPPIFRWQAGGNEITVMYNQGYGDFSPIGGSGVYLYFAHTGDNLGVQSAAQVMAILQKLQKEHPQAEIMIGNLNDVAAAARAVKDDLPVLTCEIGDSWIHGTGTDPGKTSMFRSLLRYVKEADDPDVQQRVRDRLLLVGEHTWGCDEKTHLHDYFHYTKKQLAAARRKPNFKKMEASWQEQRQYVYDALAAIPAEKQPGAKAEMLAYKRNFTDLQTMDERRGQSSASINGWNIAWNRQGEIVLLERGGRVLADEQHRLCTVRYEQFSGAQYKKYFSEYNISKVWWAREDFTKMGMGRVAHKHLRYAPRLKSAHQKDNTLVFRLAFTPQELAQSGAPAEMELLLGFEEQRIVIDFAWRGKPANRIAEGIWLAFAPVDKRPRITKLGMMIDPQDVAEKGNRRLFGTDDGVYYEHCAIHSLDAALAAFEEPALLNFHQRIPEAEKGVFFNLYNNIWGTNFPMWYDEDARFRFELAVS